MNKMTSNDKVGDGVSAKLTPFSGTSTGILKCRLLRFNNYLRMSHANPLKSISLDAVFHAAPNGYIFKPLK